MIEPETLTRSVSDLRKHLSELLDDVLDKGARIVLERRGKPVAVLLNPEDFRILDEIEYRWQHVLAERAAAEDDGTRIPFDVVRRSAKCRKGRS